MNMKHKELIRILKNLSNSEKETIYGYLDIRTKLEVNKLISAGY